MSVRFAPSPSGAFHLGNLRTAWISWLWAQELQKPWVVRFEDIDPERTFPEVRQDQLQVLLRFGMSPDRIEIQSDHHRRHWQLFCELLDSGLAYLCTCSRRDIRRALEQAAMAPHSSTPVYNGHCRNHGASPQSDLPTVGWRFRAPDESGAQDFIIARTRSCEPDDISFVPAYHWACAIDDFDGRYDLIVRAWDLLSALEPQRMIQNWLANQTRDDKSSFVYPAAFHTSLIVQNDGHRLEKRTPGTSVEDLLNNGFSEPDLLKLFASSFSVTATEYSPSRIWGEEARERTIQELGIAPK